MSSRNDAYGGRSHIPKGQEYVPITGVADKAFADLEIQILNLKIELEQFKMSVKKDLKITVTNGTDKNIVLKVENVNDCKVDDKGKYQGDDGSAYCGHDSPGVAGELKTRQDTERPQIGKLYDKNQLFSDYAHIEFGRDDLFIAKFGNYEFQWVGNGPLKQVTVNGREFVPKVVDYATEKINEFL